MKNKEIPVTTPEGDGVIEAVIISELQHLIIRIRYEDGWMNYSVGDIETVLESKNIKVKEI